MKKICFALLALLSLCACDELGNASDLFGYDPGQLNHTFYANQAGAVATFRFAAVKNWDATVSFPSAAETPEGAKWLTVTPDHGNGGLVAMSIVLNANETGKSRTAQVNIHCGDAVVALLVTQQAEEGDIPGPVPPTEARWLVDKIVLIDDSEESADSIAEIRFTYDALHRVSLLQEYDQGMLGSALSYTYGNGTITETWNEEPDDTEVVVYTLDASGRIVSWQQSGRQGGQAYDASGRLEYDGTRLSAAFTTEDGEEMSDKLIWDGNNPVKITRTERNEEYGVDLTYGSEPNNPEVNLDLNFLLGDSEWLEGAGFDSYFVKAMGFTGARSEKMLASEKEYGPYATGETVTYRYTVDSRGLITRVEQQESDSAYPDVFEITYREAK